MKESQIAFIAGQVWLAAGVIGPDGWQTLFSVVLGTVWWVTSLVMEYRETKRAFRG